MNFDNIQTWTIPDGEVGLAYTYANDKWTVVWSKKRKLWVLEIDKYYDSSDLPWDYDTTIQFSYDKLNWFEVTSDNTGSPDPSITDYIEYRPHKKLYVRWVDSSGNQLSLDKDYIYGYIVPLSNYTKYTEAKSAYDSGTTTKLEINKDDLAVKSASEDLTGNSEYNELRTNPVIVDLLFFVGWAPSNIVSTQEVSWNLPTSKSISSSKETITVNVSDPDNLGWEIYMDEPWLLNETSDSLSGTGSTSISIVVSENTVDKRSANILLKSSGTTVATCTISQAQGLTTPYWDLTSNHTLSSSGETITVNVYDPSYVGYTIVASCKETSTQWLNCSSFNTEYSGNNTFEITADPNTANSRTAIIYLRVAGETISRCTVSQQMASSNLEIDTLGSIYLGPSSGSSTTINVTSNLEWTVKNIVYDFGAFSVDTTSNTITVTASEDIPSTQINARILGTFDITDNIRTLSIRVIQNIATATLKILDTSGSEISLVNPGDSFNIRIASNTDWELTCPDLGTISIDSVPNILVDPEFKYTGSENTTITASVGYGGIAGDATTFTLTYGSKKVVKTIRLDS